MPPAWLTILLDTQNAEEFTFTYNNGHHIQISGNKSNEKWVVNVRVEVIPYFAWGCNNNTLGIHGDYKTVVKYIVGIILNQLADYGADGKDELFEALRDYLE